MAHIWHILYLHLFRYSNTYQEIYSLFMWKCFRTHTFEDRKAINNTLYCNNTCASYCVYTCYRICTGLSATEVLRIGYFLT